MTLNVIMPFTTVYTLIHTLAPLKKLVLIELNLSCPAVSLWNTIQYIAVKLHHGRELSNCNIIYNLQV